MIVEITLLFILLILGLIAALIGFLLHLMGVPITVLTGIGIALLVLVELVYIFYGMILAMGTLITFMQSYALYFLGGRYPLLGDILEPSVAAPWTSSPSFPGKGEDDQSSGPSFPMNPAPIG